MGMTRFFTGPKPRLFAHRGASGEAPENTREAFRRAVDSGIAYAELDVRATRDGHVVVIHDKTLERTTNGQGQVREHSLPDLQQLDAGYWFSPDTQQFPFRRTGVRIPTLAETLSSFPELRFTVEVKQAEPPIEELVITTVRNCGRAQDVILASEHDHIMTRVRHLAPEIATSFAASEVADFIQRVSTAQLAGYHPPGLALQIPPEFQGIPLVTTETMTAAHSLGLEVHVWTINEPQEMERLLDLGADGIMSDFPGRLREVVGRRHKSR
jgi:glycerophosphoryl diester phosphodiesterase